MRRTWVEDDRIRTRMNNLAASLMKTDRILTGRRDVTVKMRTTRETGISAPGFSNGRDITIHRDLFDNIGDAITLVEIMGLNYHELSHILMTPRNHTAFRSAVMSEKMGMAFNALEDQRIETQFVATYSAAAKYFTQMVIKFYVEDQESWPLAHILTHGRRFLPLEIREAFKERFVLKGTHDEKRVEEIIDEYRLMDLSDADSDGSLRTTALSLIREFHKILVRAQQAAQQQLPNPFGADDDGQKGCGSQQQGTTDREESRKAKERAEEKAAEQDEQEQDGEDGSGFWDDVEDEEDNDEEADESASEGDDDEEGSGSGDGDEEDEDESGDSDGEGEGGDDDEDSDSPSSSRGSGSSSDGDDDGDGEDGDDDGDAGVGGKQHGNGGDPATDDEIEDILKEILNGIMNSDQVKGDIRQMQNAINDPDAFDLDEKIRHGYEETASAEITSASVKVERELRRLFAEVEPGWKYGSDTGRLNVTRAMSSDDFEDVFDEWDEGREQATGIEVVLCIDTSGSMGGYEIQAACNALWILKRAFDSVDATVSVMSFDVVTRTLFGRHDKIDRHKIPYYGANGSDTRPAQSIRNARRILSQSEKPNKLFAILTDGQWSATNSESSAARNDYEDIESLVKSIPATTMFIGIGSTGNSYEHLFDIRQDVTHADQVAPLIKSAVTHMLKNSIRSR